MMSRGAILLVMRNRLTALTGLLVLAAVPAAAQDRNEQPQHRIVVSAGWTTFYRDEPGMKPGSRQGLTLAVAVPLSRGFAIEGSTSLLGRSSRDWYLGYLFTTQGDMRTFDQDVPILALVRLSDSCGQAGCLELVAGGGLNLHKINTRRLTVCRDQTGGRTCTPVTPGIRGDTEELVEPMLSFGADYTVHTRGRLSLTPGFRLNIFFRDEYLTGWMHRGPGNVGDMSLFAGLSVRLRQ